MAAEDWVSEGQTPQGSGWGDWISDTANDFGRAVTNAATFGMGNRLKGLISGTGTDEQARLSEVARERSPYASVAGDVYGSFAIPALGAENLALRSGAALAPTLGRAAPAVGRAIGYGATGAATGAAQGAGNTYTGNVPDYVQNALIGGAMGSVLGGAGGAAFGRGPAVSRAETPTSAQLWKEKTANYGDLANSPALYEPAALARTADQAEQVLRAQRFHESRSPVSFQALDEMRGAPTVFPTGARPVAPGDIEYIRQGFGNMNPLTDATDIASGKVVKQALDNFVRNPPPGAVLPGTQQAAAEASALAEKARGNYSGYKRVQKMEDLATAAENQAGAQYSGLNLQNELRKGVKNFVKPNQGITPAEKANFNRDEIARLTAFSRGGGRGDQVLRYIDRTLGGGGGLGATAALGVAGGFGGKYFKDDPELGTALGIAAPATGLALRMIGNRRAMNNMQQLNEMIAQRTPLYQERAAVAGMQPGAGSPRTAKALRDAVALELMKQTQPRGSPASTSDWQ